MTAEINSPPEESFAAAKAANLDTLGPAFDIGGQIEVRREQTLTELRACRGVCWRKRIAIYGELRQLAKLLAEAGHLDRDFRELPEQVQRGYERFAQLSQARARAVQRVARGVMRNGREPLLASLELARVSAVLASQYEILAAGWSASFQTTSRRLDALRAKYELLDTCVPKENSPDKN